MASAPQAAQFEVDLAGYRLLQNGHVVHLERQPMELLILLVERRGDLVTREDIAARLWGRDVFVDADQSINRAVRSCGSHSMMIPRSRSTWKRWSGRDTGL